MEEFALRSHRRAIRAIDEGRFDRETVAVRGRHRRRGPAPRHHRWRRWPRSKPVVDGGTHHRRLLLAGLRRRRGAAHRQRTGRTRARPDPARPHPPSLRTRRGPDPDAVRADPGHRVRAEEDRHDDRRHRPGRDQRGVRAGGAGLAEGDRRRPGQGQRQRRRDRAGPPARRDRREADDDPAARTGAHGRPLRPADDVRGRRPGERHDHRAALATGGAPGRPRRGATAGSAR